MRILPVAHSNHQVQFTSEVGEAVVGWRGVEPPVLGETVDVELAIDDAPYWSEVEVVSADPGLVRMPECVVRGRVEAVADDGVVTLSVGGLMLLLEGRDEVPEGLVGKVVQFEARRIAAYPTN